jgi:hypothetical protein
MSDAGERWKAVSESEKVEKPALQKALIEWNKAGQAAAPQPNLGIQNR